MIKLRVDGEPAPQGSKSVGRHGGVYEKSKKVGPWREAIKAAVFRRDIGPLDGPVEVRILFRLPRPAMHYRTGRNAHLLRDSSPRWPATRPDLDKLIRSTLDGLMQAGVYADDGQVTQISARKDYATGSEGPGAEIHIWEMTGP